MLPMASIYSVGLEENFPLQCLSSLLKGQVLPGASVTGGLNLQTQLRLTHGKSTVQLFIFELLLRGVLAKNRSIFLFILLHSGKDIFGLLR